MKRILSIFTAFAVLFVGGNIASANEAVSSEMKTAVEESVKKAHYDFSNGSLTISNVEEFNVNDPEGNVKKVLAGLAEYKTVRDNIFFKTHREVVYFDPNGNQALGDKHIALFQNEGLTQYKDALEGQLGKHMHLTVSLILHFLILIVPAFLMFVWGKQVYSTTRFKLKNNLLNQNQSFN